MTLPSLLTTTPTQQATKIPEPTNTLQFSRHGYRRTAVRHRSAAATVIVFQRTDLARAIATATFKEPLDAHTWATDVTTANPALTCAILNKFGECILFLNAPPNVSASAWTWPEAIWHGSKPIPRNKSKPTQPPLPLPF